MLRYNNSKGYTLVEVIVVIIIMGFFAAVALPRLDTALVRSRTEETRMEMIHLTAAITGYQNVICGGICSDYGYIGDIGALPQNWNDLILNPGYATWKGPYLLGDFSAIGFDSSFKFDAWGKIYSPPDDIFFSSTGGPDTIMMTIANRLGDLLHNRVNLIVTDPGKVPPGSDYVDSVLIQLSFPDGSGNLKTVVKNPEPNGTVQFDSIPIGQHQVKAIFLSTGDTLTSLININPGSDFYDELQYFEKLW